MGRGFNTDGWEVCSYATTPLSPTNIMCQEVPRFIQDYQSTSLELPWIIHRLHPHYYGLLQETKNSSSQEGLFSSKFIIHIVYLLRRNCCLWSDTNLAHVQELRREHGQRHGAESPCEDGHLLIPVTRRRRPAPPGHPIRERLSP